MSQTRPLEARLTTRPSTVERILDAAGHLLDEEGLPAFNTNAIAKRAGVNVATLYHHFSDKTDVLLQLAERIEAGRVRFFAAVGRHPDLRGDWRRMVRVGLTELHRLRREVPGSCGIRRALAAVPEAADRFRSYTERAADDLVGFMALGGTLEPGRARAAAAVIIEASGAILDLAAFHSDDPDVVLEEGSAMVIAYVASLFPELTRPT